MKFCFPIWAFNFTKCSGAHRMRLYVLCRTTWNMIKQVKENRSDHSEISFSQFLNFSFFVKYLSNSQSLWNFLNCNHHGTFTKFSLKISLPPLAPCCLSLFFSIVWPVDDLDKFLQQHVLNWNVNFPFDILQENMVLQLRMISVTYHYLYMFLASNLKNT